MVVPETVFRSNRSNMFLKELASDMLEQKQITQSASFPPRGMLVVGLNISRRKLGMSESSNLEIKVGNKALASGSCYRTDRKIE